MYRCEEQRIDVLRGPSDLLCPCRSSFVILSFLVSLFRFRADDLIRISFLRCHTGLNQTDIILTVLVCCFFSVHNGMFLGQIEPSSLKYKTHFSWQLNCWSLRCSWSIACRRCSNYIFILDLTPGFKGWGKDNYRMRRETFKFWDLVPLILET